MPDGVTPFLGLVKPEIDASPDTWGDKYNANMDKIDAAYAQAGGRFLGALQNRTSGTGSPPTVTVNAWTDYPINHELYDPDSVLSLASNTFTCSEDGTVEWFAQGHMDLSASAPANSAGFFKTRLYDVTDAAVVADGHADHLGSPNGEYWYNLKSRGVGLIVAGHSYKLQYFMSPPSSGTIGYLGTPYIGATYGTAYGDRINGQLVFRK